MKTYQDILIEGIPTTKEGSSNPKLPSDYSNENLGCIPKIPLPNGRFLFYMRGNYDVIERIKNDSRVNTNIIANSWSELFYGNYKYWNWIFDFEILEYQTIFPEEKPQKITVRRKLAEIKDQEIVGVYVPGIFSGDSNPRFPIPEFTVENYNTFDNSSKKLDLSIKEITLELKQYLRLNPKAMYDISPRKFEELICDILTNFGWEVELTSITKDGGYDIIGFNNLVGGIKSNWIIECKRYSPHRKVGVDIVRSICGVKDNIKMGNAMIVTTSSFTKGAHDLVKSRWDLELKDYDKINEWLRN